MDEGRTGMADVCHTEMVRTTLDLDDELMGELLSRLPGVSKTSAIEQAIAAFLDRHTVAKLTALAGTMEVEDVSAELRSRDRTS